MPDTIEAKVTHRYKASPERVFRMFTDPQKIALWHKAWLVSQGLPGDVVASDFTPEKGAKLLFADRRDGGEARHWGEILAVDEPSKISFSWITDRSQEADPSVVAIIIEPFTEGWEAMVTLYHEMNASWASHREGVEKSWIAMLEAVEKTMIAETAERA